MTREEFITKALTLSTEDEFGALFDEIAHPSRAQEMTKNGAAVLEYLQGRKDEEALTAKTIGDEMGVSSRSVSGAMRKLVSDGYVEKIGTNPSVYRITEKGQNYSIDN